MPLSPSSVPQAHLDRLARAKGFPDFATYAAWQAKQSQGLRQTQATQRPNNFLQYLGPLYPPNLFNHISDVLGNATGG